MNRISIFLIISSISVAQEVGANSLTFRGGSAHYLGANCCVDSTYLLGGSYGYRLRNYLQLEVGVDFAPHPTRELRGANYQYSPGDSFVWVPFGVRGILPLGNRFELFAAGGGLYERYNGYDSPIGLVPSRNAWGGYFSAGAGVAIDSNRHFWVHAAPRWYLTNSDGPYARNRWFAFTGEFSVRF